MMSWGIAVGSTYRVTVGWQVGLICAQSKQRKWDTYKKKKSSIFFFLRSEAKKEKEQRQKNPKAFHLPQSKQTLRTWACLLFGVVLIHWHHLFFFIKEKKGEKRIISSPAITWGKFLTTQLLFTPARIRWLFPVMPGFVSLQRDCLWWTASKKPNSSDYRFFWFALKSLFLFSFIEF